MSKEKEDRKIFEGKETLQCPSYYRYYMEKENYYRYYMEKEKDRISSMVLNGLSQAVQEHFDEILETYRENDGIIDITLTVEGHKVDVKSFIEFWQSQVRIMIREQAEKITNELFDFTDIDDLIIDLKDRLQNEINKRLEDWEKEGQ